MPVAVTPTSTILPAKADGGTSPRITLLARLQRGDGAALDLLEGAAWQIEAQAADGRSFALRCEPQRAADEAVIGQVIRIADTTAAMLAQRQRDEVMQLLSHDMRSPQVSILTLLDRAPEDSLQAQIRLYAQRTLAMADGFVQLSRAQSLRFEPLPVDLADVLREASDALWPQASARQVQVACALPEGEVLVLGDRSLLARAFVNLIDNAVRYSAAGQTVEVSLTLGATHCEAVVADHGAGMAPEQVERLFERFASGSAAKGGIGLGLAFVQAAIQRHQGQIACESEAGRGTLFRVQLPRA
jgi:signal transduction histidine kinase